ncbi:MAG: glycosyltransferase family protein [Candidatus Aureabacteria bacterium]|nr:glycosyltransferase family protein [Candidatus Auribacterota bacterium]
MGDRKVVAVIQARMGSTRLPGKVMKDICGRTMLARVVGRTRRASLLDEVIVATTVNADDDAIVAECSKLGVQTFRGEEYDVLDRYYRAALHARASAVVRITSDCPLIDPEVTDKVIGAFLEGVVDCASNSLERTYPLGLDVAAVSMDALSRAWSEATERYERVHVTPFICLNPSRFRILSVKGDGDYSGYRWTVDTPEDLEFVRMVYAKLGGEKMFLWQEVIDLLEREPWIAEINRHVRQKTIEEC